MRLWLPRAIASLMHKVREDGWTSVVELRWLEDWPARGCTTNSLSILANHRQSSPGIWKAIAGSGFIGIIQGTHLFQIFNYIGIISIRRLVKRCGLKNLTRVTHTDWLARIRQYGHNDKDNYREKTMQMLTKSCQRIRDQGTPRQ